MSMYVYVVYMCTCMHGCMGEAYCINLYMCVYVAVPVIIMVYVYVMHVRVHVMYVMHVCVHACIHG